MTNLLQVEEMLKTILSYDGVVGFVVVNNAGENDRMVVFRGHDAKYAEGIPIKSSMDDSTSVVYAGLVQQLMNTSKTVIKKYDSTDDLKFLRLRTQKHEICIIPEKQYVLIVVQSPIGARPPL